MALDRKPMPMAGCKTINLVHLNFLIHQVEALFQLCPDEKSDPTCLFEIKKIVNQASPSFEKLQYEIDSLEKKNEPLVITKNIVAVFNEVIRLVLKIHSPINAVSIEDVHYKITCLEKELQKRLEENSVSYFSLLTRFRTTTTIRVDPKFEETYGIFVRDCKKIAQEYYDQIFPVVEHARILYSAEEYNQLQHESKKIHGELQEQLEKQKNEILLLKSREKELSSLLDEATVNSVQLEKKLYMSLEKQKHSVISLLQKYDKNGLDIFVKYMEKDENFRQDYLNIKPILSELKPELSKRIDQIYDYFSSYYEKKIFRCEFDQKDESKQSYSVTFDILTGLCEHILLEMADKNPRKNPLQKISPHLMVSMCSFNFQTDSFFSPHHLLEDKVGGEKKEKVKLFFSFALNCLDKAEQDRCNRFLLHAGNIFLENKDAMIQFLKDSRLVKIPQMSSVNLFRNIR